MLKAELNLVLLGKSEASFTWFRVLVVSHNMIISSTSYIIYSSCSSKASRPKASSSNQVSDAKRRGVASLLLESKSAPRL